jgi:transmembrane 9 superfamily protein 2/4
MRKCAAVRRLLVLLCVANEHVAGFYLPGVTPRTYKEGEKVSIKVNKLTSTQTQLPYDYYDLPFPKPTRGVKEAPENLGEYLEGNRIENSGYQVLFLRNENCKLLKRMVYSDEDTTKFMEFIHDGYHANWIMDNLPSAAAIDDEEARTQTVSNPPPFACSQLILFAYRLCTTLASRLAKCMMSGRLRAG